MYLSVVLLISGLWTIHGQQVEFTINSIELTAIPSTKLTNGQRLELKCLVGIAKTTDFVLNSTISFYKDDVLIYEVTTAKEQETYTIQKARVSHSAEYKCGVSVRRKEKKSKTLQVKVTGLSAPSINVSKSEVTEGDDVTVRCEAPEEEPPMLFRFYKINQDDRDPKSKTPKGKYAEAIFEIKEGENILHFECDVKLLAKAEEISPVNRSQTVTVVAPFATPRIEVTPTFNFTEGVDMTVTCTVLTPPRSQDEVTITLQKDGHIVNSSTTRTLSYFQFATVKDMGNYTCKAEGKRASKASSVMITVAELFPRPRLTLKRSSNKTEYIQEDDLLVLECSVPDLSLEDSNKQAFNFIVNKGMKRHTRKEGRLQLLVKENDSGSYTCEFTKSRITKTSDPVLIQVYAPVAKPILKYIIKKMVVPGDTLELTCKSQFGTPPIKYSLLRGNEPLETKEMYRNMEAKFLVNVTKPHDSGQYRCHATNRNTRSNEYSEIVNVTVIIPVEDVSLTIIPSNGEVEEGAELSLVCSVKKGTLPIHFHFYVKKGILLHNVTKTDDTHASFQVSSFSSKGDGAYYCVASNSANTTLKSRSTDVKAILATWKKGVIGGFVLLIIAAAIAVILYLYLDKKNKGKDISTDKTRTAKAVNSSNEKSVVEMKTDDSYFGSIQNEEELHILKTAEENIGNNKENHDVEYTEVDAPTADPHQDAVETNINRIEDAPEANNHT